MSDRDKKQPNAETNNNWIFLCVLWENLNVDLNRIYGSERVQTNLLVELFCGWVFMKFANYIKSALHPVFPPSFFFKEIYTCSTSMLDGFINERCLI